MMWGCWRGTHVGGCKLRIVQEQAEQFRLRQRRGPDAGHRHGQDAVEGMRRRGRIPSAVRPQQLHLRQRLLQRIAAGAGPALLRPGPLRRPPHAARRQRLRHERRHVLPRLPAGHSQDGVARRQGGRSGRGPPGLPQGQLINAGN